MIAHTDLSSARLSILNCFRQCLVIYRILFSYLQLILLQKNFSTCSLEVDCIIRMFTQGEGANGSVQRVTVIAERYGYVL
jgi:hypothetical protein